MMRLDELQAETCSQVYYITWQLHSRGVHVVYDIRQVRFMQLGKCSTVHNGHTLSILFYHLTSMEWSIK